MLWKRKLYKKRVARNEVKKVRKHFFREKDEKEGEDHQEDNKPDESGVTEKQKEFYKQLFAKDGTEEIPKKKKKKNKKPSAVVPGDAIKEAK